MLVEKLHIARDRRNARGVHAPVAREHVASAPGQRCAAAAAAAGACRNERRIEEAVELVDELPCALVAHAHAPAGRGNRARLENAFEELGLAGAEIDARREADAQAHERSDVFRFHEASREYGPEAPFTRRRGAFVNWGTAHY